MKEEDLIKSFQDKVKKKEEVKKESLAWQKYELELVSSFENDKIFRSKLDKAISIFKKENLFKIKNLKYGYWICTTKQLEDKFSLTYYDDYIPYCEDAVKFKFFTERKSRYHNDLEEDITSYVELQIFQNHISLISKNGSFDREIIQYLPNKGPQPGDINSKVKNNEKYHYKEIVNIKNKFVEKVYKAAELLI